MTNYPYRLEIELNLSVWSEEDARKVADQILERLKLHATADGAGGVVVHHRLAGYRVSTTRWDS